jgi:polyhydroxybutyrate depolymerase
MKAFDRNKDGKLDNTEKKLIREYFERRVNKESAIPANRKDEIRVPDNYNEKKKYPFILTLHGYTSNGEGQLKFFPLSELAEKYGFIYCAPDGIDRSWNATDACCDWRNKVDDSKYLRSIILEAIKNYSIDKKRIYVTGLSNGGFMCYRMAHEHSDIITAIVPFAGVGFSDWPSKPTNPVSVLHVHGTKDRTIKWGGGDIRSSNYPSAKENFQHWKSFNECDIGINTSKVRIDLDKKISGAETKVTRFESKDGKITTELWTVAGGGHVTRPSRHARERIIKWMFSQSK